MASRLMEQAVVRFPGAPFEPGQTSSLITKEHLSNAFQGSLRQRKLDTDQVDGKASFLQFLSESLNEYTFARDLLATY